MSKFFCAKKKERERERKARWINTRKERSVSYRQFQNGGGIIDKRKHWKQNEKTNGLLE